MAKARIGLKFNSVNVGLKFNSAEINQKFTAPSIGMIFRKDVMLPEEMELGNTEDTIGYTDDSYGFMGLERR